VPAGGKDRVKPGRGAKPLGDAAKVAPGAPGLGGDCGSGLLRAQIEPADASHILVENVVGPAEFQHDLKIAGVAFVAICRYFSASCI